LAVSSSDFKTTDASVHRLHELSLQSEVEAAIVSDDLLWNKPITVSVQGSVITLRGFVKSKKIRDQIADIASQVKGVTGCDVHIALSSDPLRGGRHWRE
jgi:osmotically-inducible protein OsmY